MNKKVLYIILLGIIIVGGGFYFYRQNDLEINIQDSSNEIFLDTYVDKKYNFELKYPKNWSIGRYLSDANTPIKDGDLLVELDFSNYSAEEAEEQYQTNSKYPKDLKNINVKVYSSGNTYKYEFSIFPKDDTELNELVEIIKK